MSAMRPILLRDACVVTMDPVLGELSRGAVLIEGDRIARIASIISSNQLRANYGAGHHDGRRHCAQIADTHVSPRGLPMIQFPGD